MNEAVSSGSQYFVWQNGEVKGPFDLDMVEAFILSGHYPKDVQICAEGSTQWHSHSPTIGSPEHATRPFGATPVPPNPSQGVATWKIVVGILIGLGMLAAICSTGTRDTTTPGKSLSDTPVVTRPTGSLPRTYYPSPAASPDVLYKGVGGHTYMVPNSDSGRLSRWKEALEQEEAVVNAAEASLDAEQTELERHRAYLDRTNQYEIRDFNTKVDAFNAKNLEVKRKTAAFNAHVDAFNKDLARVGRLVH